MANSKIQKKIILIVAITIISIVTVFLIVPLAFVKNPIVLPSDTDVSNQTTHQPSVEITSLKKDIGTSSFIVQGLSIKAQNNDIHTVEVKLDDGSYKTATPKAEDDWSSWSISFDATTIQDGIHVIIARILDNEGDEIISTRLFNYNLNPIVITNPKFDEIITGKTITITGTTDIKEDDGIEIVEVKLDDGSYKTATPKAEDDWSSWSISFDATTIQDGPHIIIAHVIDYDGNKKIDSTSFNYVTGPIIITHPRFEYILSGETITITGTTHTTGDNGIQLVEVKLDDGSYKTATPKAEDDWSSWSISFDATNIQDGIHVIRADILDYYDEKAWDLREFTYSSSILPKEVHDDFSKELYSMKLGSLSPNGNLFAMWHDGGTLGVIRDYANDDNNVFLIQSGVVEELDKTKSAMVLTSSEYKNFKLSVDVRTDQQLRKNNPPNEWEVGWVVWAYQDPTHFNYFLLKPIGAEFGKYDGGRNPEDQKELFFSTSTTSSIGEWSHWDIIVDNTHMTILVNGTTVFEFDDFASFDTGRIGFYLEDSAVSFDNLIIIPSWN